MYNVHVQLSCHVHCTYIQEETNGDIQVALRYNPTMNIMIGIVIKATGLKKKDMIGLSRSGVCVCVN